jgi:hypothetical protein
LLCDLPLDGESNNSENSDIPAVINLIRFVMTVTLWLDDDIQVSQPRLLPHSGRSNGHFV